MTCFLGQILNSKMICFLEGRSAHLVADWLKGFFLLIRRCIVDCDLYFLRKKIHRIAVTYLSDSLV